MIKKLIHILLIVVIFASLASAREVGAQGDCYAVLDSLTPTTSNMSVWMGSNTAITTVTIGGKTGWRLNASSGTTTNSYLYANVNNTYLNKVLNYKNFEIEVTYFDGTVGWFMLQYDSRNGSSYEGEMVYLMGTAQWKTHRFRLEDAYFGDRLSGADFRLSVYKTPTTYSSAQVVIAQIAVTDDNTYAPIKIEVGSERLGNTFFTGDNLNFDITLTNKTNSAKSFEIISTIFDSDGLVYAVYNDSTMLDANSSIVKRLVISDVLYGVYMLNVLVSNEESSIRWWKDTEFAYSVANSRNNGDLGACMHFYKHRNQVSAIAEVIRKSGISSVRDEILWFDYEKNDVFKVPDADMKYINALVNNGIEPLIILGFGHTKHTSSLKSTTLLDGQKELDAYYNYVYNLVLDLRGKVNWFEIWNEPDQSTDDDSARKYSDMMITAYTAAKAANPKAYLAGFSIAGVNGVGARLDWTKSVMDHLVSPANYCDRIALHTYCGTDIPELQIVRKMQGYVDAFDDRNAPTDSIWITEFGYYTTVGRVPDLSEEIQASYLVRQYILLKARGINDKLWVYDFIDDGVIRNNREHNFGLLKASGSQTPYAAKASFLALSHMNNKIGSVTSVREVVKSGGTYVYEFTNDVNDNIYVMWTTQETASILLEDFDYQDADFYDMYGNSTNILTADGKYVISGQPVYAVVVESGKTREYSERKVDIHGFSQSGIAGETVTLTVLKDENLFGTDEMWDSIAYIGTTKTDAQGAYRFEFSVNRQQEEYVAYVSFGSGWAMRKLNFTAKGVFQADLKLYRNGEFISDAVNVSEGDILRIEATFLGISSQTDYAIVCAVYDGDKLVQIVQDDGRLEKSNTSQAGGFNFTVEASSISRIKLFFWNALGEMKPYSIGKIYYNQ